MASGIGMGAAAGGPAGATPWRTVVLGGNPPQPGGRQLPADGLRLLEEHDPHGMAVRWLHQSAHDASAWIRHSVPERWLQTPMLLLGGWWDPHLRGLLTSQNAPSAVGGQPALHIGPATHLQWWPQSSNLLLNFFQQHLQNHPQRKPVMRSP